MISVRVGDCDVDILPFVNGLQTEADKVRDAYGRHEAYGIAMSIEGVQALENREGLDEDFGVSELDLVYANKMERFGTVEIPSPAACVLVDLCKENGTGLIPLDMNDADFTELYCSTVKTLDFVKEHRHAKKGMKKAFDAGTPEELAIQWDEFVNEIGSYREVSRKREEYIAEQISDVAKYRKSLLVLLEVERCDGVLALLERR
ncbi:MAG: hypothetical protein IKG94_04925 [Candidatus Methanomethylophilaceae archaeon]|jgi:hypothetical protein|nr:hypothetical protein [Candidatus Methanomethylophilaceae archaeon]MBR4225500.1 hypothetical protein [Candidatus Methanomethylophilaceae archaeon]